MLARWATGLGLCFAATGAAAHLLTPYQADERVQVSRLYKALGVAPPNYSLLTQPYSHERLHELLDALGQRSAYVSDVALPLTLSVLLQWNLSAGDLEWAGRVLARVKPGRGPLLGPLRAERLAETRWLVQLFQQSQAEQLELLHEALTQRSAFAVTALLVLARRDDAAAWALTQTLIESPSSLSPRLHSVRAEMALRRRLLPHGPVQRVQLLAWKLSEFRSTSADLDFTVLCRLLSDQPTPLAAAVLEDAALDFRYGPTQRRVAKLCLERWHNSIGFNLKA